MSTTFVNRGHFYCPHVKPVLIDCNFTVDSTNGNGFGVRSLKGQGISSLFMNTSATPGRTAAGVLNPNPAAGYIVAQLTDNYNRYYGGFSGFVSPLSGSTVVINSTLLTLGVVYTIVVVGTSTLADWLAVGLPPGVVPAVGASFTAIKSGNGSGSGLVEAIATAGAGIDHIEVVGDPNTSIGPIPVGGSPNVGGWINMACFYNDALTAPANNTTIGLSFYLGQSSVVVKGE